MVASTTIIIVKIVNLEAKHLRMKLRDIPKFHLFISSYNSKIYVPYVRILKAYNHSKQLTEVSWYNFFQVSQF